MKLSLKQIIVAKKLKIDIVRFRVGKFRDNVILLKFVLNHHLFKMNCPRSILKEHSTNVRMLVKTFD